MNILNKYIWLIDTISRAGKNGITFEDINRKYQYADSISGGSTYNIRTFHNHRKDILVTFGIEISCYTDGYRYYIVDENELNGTSRFRRWLLESVSVTNIITNNKNVCDRIMLEDIPSAENSLSKWLTAIQENKMVQFEYLPFWTNEIIHYSDFIPLCLKLFKRRWYIVGHTGDEKNKIYSIDRMLKVELEDKIYTLPQHTNAETFFSGCFGVYVDDTISIETIKLKVTPRMANYLRSLPLHHSQKEVKKTDVFSLFHLSVRPTPDFIQELLSYGDSIEILSPENLRKTMKEKILRMYKIYEHNDL